MEPGFLSDPDVPEYPNFLLKKSFTALPEGAKQ
jgi:hypothetical protein